MGTGVDRVTGLPNLSQESMESLKPIVDELKRKRRKVERNDMEGKVHTGGYGRNGPGMKVREDGQD